jgi:hypothetical protein
MHRDVGVCSIGHDELTAVLLLRQQCGHAVQPAPGLWNGRERVLRSDCSFAANAVIVDDVTAARRLSLEASVAAR